MSSEIELLRQKRALELRKKMLLSQEKPISAQPVPPKLSSKETVRKVLEGRGAEVLETARRYYPKETAEIENTLAGLIEDRKSTRLNSSHVAISYAVFCLKKKK